MIKILLKTYITYNYTLRVCVVYDCSIYGCAFSHKVINIYNCLC